MFGHLIHSSALKCSNVAVICMNAPCSRGPLFALRQWLPLRFDFDLTARRPFDHPRRDIQAYTCVRVLLRCGINKQVSLTAAGYVAVHLITLRAGCSQKFSPCRRPLPGGAGRPKFNQLEMVTTFTYRPSLVKIDARNFELSCNTHKPTDS